MEKATFGAGCFWCAEAALKLLPGVISVTPGYAGGNIEDPSYQEVATGKTGHVEAVQVAYDPAKTLYQDLLKIFWEIHNPTEKDRQGPDVGKEYQAVIFTHTPEQQRLAEESKKAVAEKYSVPVMTEIRPLKNFYPAKEYHKDFYEKNPYLPYSQAVIAPKVEKVKKILKNK